MKFSTSFFITLYGSIGGANVFFAAQPGGDARIFSFMAAFVMLGATIAYAIKGGIEASGAHQQAASDR